MACGLFIRVCLLALTSVAATQHQDDGSIMRRQKSGSQQVHLGPGGELLLHEDHSEHKSKPMDVSQCDYTGSEGAVNTNECPVGATKILTAERCVLVAEKLGHTVGRNSQGHILLPEDPETAWDVTPSTFPEGCFISTVEGEADVARFNSHPTRLNGTAGWTGTPICEEKTYFNGTAGLDSQAGCDSDAGYAPITTYAECQWARTCEDSGNACQTGSSGNQAFETQDAPAGCYTDVQGCYGFNNAVLDDPSRALPGTKPVCRLASAAAFVPVNGGAAPTPAPPNDIVGEGSGTTF